METDMLFIVCQFFFFELVRKEEKKENWKRNIS